jgi:hypothetical protein
MDVAKTIGQAIEEHRVAIVQMDPKFIIQVLNWWRNPTCMLCLPITDKLPADCEVIAVNMSFERNFMQLKIVSKYFEPVDRSVFPPEIPEPFCKWEARPFPNADALTSEHGESIKWISASDELPDSGSEVLVCFERNDCEERDTYMAEFDDSREGESPWWVDGGQTHFGVVMFWAEKPVGPTRS